jgi:methyl-accepting chemotaxis protein
VPALKRKPKSPQQAAGRGGSGGAAGPRRQGRPTGAAGGVQGVNIIVLVLVAASVTIAAGLLAETVNTARSIDKKATNIKNTGIGINKSTDAIRQLVLTNKVEQSILKTATPLNGVLTKIDNTAKSIDKSAVSIDSLASTILSTAGTINTSATTINGHATKINSTAGTINGTAKQIDDVANSIQSTASKINGTAKTINTTAGTGPGILGIARIIDNDAATIVQGLTATNQTASGIKVDSGDILGDSNSILDTGGCIDVNANTIAKPPNASDCQGKNP